MPPEFRSNNDEVNHALENEVDILYDCIECNVSMDDVDVSYNNDGDAYCEDCYSELYVSCDDCGEETHNEDSSTSPYGSAVCHNCYEDRYDDCDRCGDTCDRDDMIWNDNMGAYNCENCYDNEDNNPDWEVMSNEYVDTRNDFITPVGSGYSMHDGKIVKQTNPDMLDYATRKDNKADKWMKDSHDIIKSKRNVGLELEINLDQNIWSDFEDHRGQIHGLLSNAIHKTRHTKWYRQRYRPWEHGNIGIDVVNDSSVTSGNHPFGVEVVTSPRRGDVIDADIRTICEALTDEGAYVSQNCGLHLHVDTSDYDYIHFSVLSTLTKMIEPHVYAWLPSSRRNSRWAQPVSQSLGHLTHVYNRDDFIETWYDTERYFDEKYHEKRYHGLNLHCHFYARQGTEIRYHSGTLNPDKIKHWVVFWTQVFDTAYEIGEQVRKSSTSMANSNFRQSLVVEEKCPLSDVEKQLLSKYDMEVLKDYHFVKSTPDLHILYRKLRDYHRVDTNVSLYSIVSAYQYRHAIFSERVKALTFDAMMDLFSIPKSTRDYYYNRYYDRRNDTYFDHNHLNRCYSRVTDWYDYDTLKQEFIRVGDSNNRLKYWNQVHSRRGLSRFDWLYNFQTKDVLNYICRPVDEYVNARQYSNISYTSEDNRLAEIYREQIREVEERLGVLPF
jgi:hypothetical protein